MFNLLRGSDPNDCFTPPEALPRGYGAPPAEGDVKRSPEDFEVREILGFEPDGEGPHAWLEVRKRDANTVWAARRIARAAGVRAADVGYAGLKDRTATTTQWFSVPIEGRPEPDWDALRSDGLEVLRVCRHRRKLRRGGLAGNAFVIRLRDVAGSREGVAERIEAVRAGGVPNYFGAQRFGREAGNVARAWEMLHAGRRVRDRHRRGLYLSAARALVFNRVLAHRVRGGTWQQALDGDVMMLEGTRSIFPAARADDALAARLARLDVHPTGPLWGKGEPPTRDAALEVECAALDGCTAWTDALAAAGLRQERRALRVAARELRGCFDAEALRLAFTLPAGAYATMAVREIVAPRT